MGIDEIQKTLGIDLLSFQGERKAESSEKSSAFSKILGEKQQKCPYSHLAKDGLIEYNGVIFVCDYKRNMILKTPKIFVFGVIFCKYINPYFSCTLRPSFP